jgi:ATP-dependent helicase/nuclease subunit A
VNHYTPDQLKAIEARGDTLVVAGAGAGKTGTLVERCIRILLDDKVAVSKILVVTFTEAAAAEVRERIRKRLEKAAENAPEDPWVQEQMAALDSAHICTLHSFCLTLLRENFYALDLDPSVTVMPGEQAEMLFWEAFEELLREHFAGEHDFSAALQEVLQTHFGGWDKPLREFIRKLHHYTQTRPGPEEWFTEQIGQFESDGTARWRQCYERAVREWCAWWAGYLASLPAENENGRACAELLQAALTTRDLGVVSAVLARKECWNRRKGKDSAAFGSFFAEAEFLDSLRDQDALEQDWQWNAAPLLVLLKFGRQFSERYGEAKRARGVVDFHDLEQGALRLLWDGTAKSETQIAKRWQQRLEAVFVDEYQDINAAQDLILRAVSGERSGKRFLVGDIKQSIYAFRQADPSIFRKYLEQSSSGQDWKPVFLSDNFRSHEGILNFINPLFAWLMQEKVGGIAYDERAALRFGAPERRAELKQPAGEQWPVELHLLLTSKGTSRENDDEEDDEDLDAVEAEARIVAQRLRELKEAKHAIYHQKEGKIRPVEWRDMVVLLRAASNKVEVYAKAFAAIGVPLETKRDGFFSAQEVLDLCNVLTILDNPQQDIPLVAVLRSPLVGMSANELAVVRVTAGRSRNFWNALHAYLEAKKENETSAKIQLFLERYRRWRNPHECFSLAQRLERVLGETGYAEWLLSQPRGRQRYANVQQLVRVARQFDEARGESLYLFLRHIQQLQESAGDLEPAAIAEANAVRLMTVHQSKGLEFPVVAVADLGKRFNTTDQNSGMLLHDEYGLCAMIQVPGGGAKYPSLPLWLAGREQRLNAAGEEMRVMYVALTRAENLLLLFGSASEKQPERWGNVVVDKEGRLYPQQLTRTKSWLDWIGTHASGEWPGCFSGRDSDIPFAVRLHREPPKALAKEAAVAPEVSPTEQIALRERIHFVYTHEAAVVEPAKTSVSALRNRMQLRDEEAAAPKRFVGAGNGVDGRRRGLASHAFLQHLDLNGVFDEESLKTQASELVRAEMLEKSDLDLIEWEAIAAFWNSEVGMEIRKRTTEVRRELPFTFKLRNEDVKALGAESTEFTIPDGEFVVVQGVADLVVLGADEIWLIDFKTDAVKAREVGAKVDEYRAQIALYARALEGIYHKRVTRRGLFFLAARKLEWLE